ncbi:hypothetical protein COLO4_15744 [Corchorus olitorius]|uniref:Endoplasmic reticulum vesicle transporter C-terminal domain-containing protein n=1 Tax=Corchorus olitorius TaxID=93759 RepID=A0A1R3JL76_9ROSI|nr:hypothetical protein COLO4_15744 [Corchorus olitorius]
MKPSAIISSDSRGRPSKSPKGRPPRDVKGGNSLDVWLGRLAMVGFVVAITVEISTGKGLLECKGEGFLQKIKDEEGEWCNIYGFLEVNKVAGNSHFAPGKVFSNQMLTCMHDLLAFQKDSLNISHKINRLAFVDYIPGVMNPLDGKLKTFKAALAVEETHELFLQQLSTALAQNNINLQLPTSRQHQPSQTNQNQEETHEDDAEDEGQEKEWAFGARINPFLTSGTGYIFFIPIGLGTSHIGTTRIFVPKPVPEQVWNEIRNKNRPLQAYLFLVV